MKSKTVSVITLICLLAAPSKALCEPIVSPMQKGQIAPFAGVLMSPEATAVIITEISSVQEKIDIEVKKVKDTAAAQCNFALNEEKSICQTDKNVLASQLAEKVKYAQQLEEEIKRKSLINPAEPPSRATWASIGFLGGAVLTGMTIFALSTAIK